MQCSYQEPVPHQALACLRALVAPGASKPGKLLLQYPVELSIGVASLCVPTSLELAFRGVSASNIPFLCLLCHRLLHCRERRDGGERGRVRVLAALVEECGIKARRCLRCSRCPEGGALLHRKGRLEPLQTAVRGP